jgi:hypothetical protein
MNNLLNNTTNTVKVALNSTNTIVAVSADGDILNDPNAGDFTLTYVAARNAGLGVTTTEGVPVALVKPNIGVDQNDVSLYTLTAGIVFPDESDVWYDTGLFGPTGSEYTPAMRASDITVTGGAGATLSAPDIGLDIVVDDLTGTLEAGGSGYSAAWVGSNPE